MESVEFPVINICHDYDTFVTMHEPILTHSVCVCVCVCVCARTLVVQSCPTLCDRMDCTPPGSSVHGIFQV